MTWVSVVVVVVVVLVLVLVLVLVVVVVVVVVVVIVVVVGADLELHMPLDQGTVKILKSLTNSIWPFTILVPMFKASKKNTPEN